MKKRPKILVTNDDGVHAPGIKHLWNAVKEMADLIIVAPSAEQSAVGVSITIRHPLRIDQVSWPSEIPAWCVNGTPADCIKLALNVLLEFPPDLIISGINRGTNAGRNIFYSGTVGGVIEGIMHAIPGIAFSCLDYYEPQYAQTEKYIPAIINHVLEHPLPEGTLLNVNFPSKHMDDVKGFKLARQGKEYWAEDPDHRTHPAEGHSYYWLGAKLAAFEEDEESDVAWLRKGFITAVPIHVGELTDHEHLRKRKNAFEQLFGAA